MSERELNQGNAADSSAQIASVPSWFRSKPKEKSVPPPPSPTGSLLDIPEPNVASYCQPTVGSRITNVARSEEAISCAFSFAFHLFLGLGVWILLLVLQSYDMLPSRADFKTVELNAALGDEEVLDDLPQLETVPEVEIDMGSTSAPEESPELGQTEILNVTDFISSTAVGSASSSDQKDGKGKGEKGTGFRFTVPKGGKAVTRGSFSAWTIPADPDVGEDYQIIIQIQLPEGTKTYRARDLSGIVSGTDSYTQRLPGPLWGELPIIDNSVQLAIPVPGAKRAFVTDTIRIRSRLLKERQTLQIQF